ncbi:hypothetical protein [Ktedonobacter racemifer]|uniref:hypothetical protein n=1 Tax=Ktedonobacter racemifer TaxID=363277 RepID=UPI00058F11CB|nr:hypothetical protein [Ktedonobacter racemifer]
MSWTRIAVAIVIGPLSGGRGSLAADQADIFDLVAHTMLDHGIVPVDDRRNDLLVPDQEATVSRIGVQHEAHAGVVAFALHAINATSLAAEAYSFGFPNTDPIDRLIGASRKGLSHRALNVVDDPGDTGTLGILVHLIF